MAQQLNSSVIHAPDTVLSSFPDAALGQHIVELLVGLHAGVDLTVQLTERSYAVWIVSHRIRSHHTLHKHSLCEQTSHQVIVT